MKPSAGVKFVHRSQHLMINQHEVCDTIHSGFAQDQPEGSPG